METVLGFFSDLVLFTAGLIVLLFWVAIFLVIADEVIDLIITYRNRNRNNTEKEEN